MRRHYDFRPAEQIDLLRHGEILHQHGRNVVFPQHGFDGVFIGPSDLSASLGHVGNPAHPEVQRALEDAVRRLKAVGKPAGILTGNEDEARRYIAWGYTFVAVGSDVGLVGRGADALAKKFKS